jgi:hypothetical protein
LQNTLMDCLKKKGSNKGKNERKQPENEQYSVTI